MHTDQPSTTPNAQRLRKYGAGLKADIKEIKAQLATIQRILSQQQQLSTKETNDVFRQQPR